MDINQDADLTILPDTGKPKEVADSDETLPQFQFLDGRGTLQNSTERPIEGFVALKITYEHVLRKQKEQTRLLQQKNQQLISEIQQLKGGMGTQINCGQDDGGVTCNDQHLHVITELINKCPNEDMKELSLQLTILEANKAKLKSGLCRLANCLLKRESDNSPLSDLLKKILDKLHGSQCDSEDTIRELCSLVNEMCDLDDSNKLDYNQEPDQGQLPAASNSTDASLQKIVTNYQQLDLPIFPDSQYERQRNFTRLTSYQEKDKFKDEDMYGPDGTPANSDLVPYNLVRLHLKLMKLQQFPSEYRSIAQNSPSMSLQQRKELFSSWNGSMLTSPRNLLTETKLASSPPGLPTCQMPSFIGIHSIKMPPTDFPNQVHVDTGGTGIYNQEPPAHNEIMKDVQRQALTTGSLLPKADALAGIEKASSRLRHTQFEQVCGPPSHSQNIPSDANNFPKLHLGASCDAASSVNHESSDHQETCEKQNAPTVISSGRKECVSTPMFEIESRHELVPLPVKTEIPYSKHSESTLVITSPQSSCMPGFESKHDQLVTAHTNMSIKSVNVTLMECPVCSQLFPHGTSEETVASHVNLHFDETLHPNDSFEILNE